MSAELVAPQGFVLALDGATEHLTLAAASEAGLLLGSRTVHLGREHAARLPAELAALLAQVARQRGELSGICVGTGPGSYTGIRVSLAFARGLARALSVPLVGASSLIAVGGPRLAPGADGVALLDARRGNCYAQALRREDAGGEAVPVVRALGSPVKLPREEVAAAFAGLEVLAEGPPDAAFLCAHAIEREREPGDLTPLYL